MVFHPKPSHGAGGFHIPWIALSWAFLFVLVIWASPAVAQETEADVYVAQAILYYDDKRYPEALSLLTEALKLEPENTQALYYTGLAHLAQKNPVLAVEYLEKARTKSPNDQVILYQLGVAYFTLEQYDKAEPLLEAVFKEQPRLENLGYYVGFMRYRHKDYDGSVKAFKTGASTDPTMQQLTRFYASLAMGILGLSEGAIVEVDEALRLQPASPLTGPAERIRDSIVKAREREQRLRDEIRLGVTYDDNVTINPRPSTDPTAEALRTRQSRSMGELALARVDYSWLRTGPWEATASYSFFQTVYNNDGVSNFNLQDHLGSLGGFYRGAVKEMPYQLGASYSYDWLSLGSNPFLTRHTATAFGTLVENAGNMTTLVGRAQFKNFLQDSTTPPQLNRDGRNWMIGPTHVFRFEGDRHLIRVGYQFDYEDAEGRDFSYTGQKFLAGGQYTLPWGETRLRYDYEVHFRKYDNVNTFPLSFSNRITRDDTEQVHAFRIEKPLPHNLTASAEYLGDFNHSNLSIYEYTRNTFTLYLSWQY